MAKISIRPYRASDAEPLCEAASESSSEVFPWLPWCHPKYAIDEARDWVSQQVEAWRTRTRFDFAIVSGSGEFLGSCGVSHLERVDRRANLGYWVRSAATGRGVATEAVCATVRWAFEHTDLERLEIAASIENVPSQRVAEKAGAQREGIARSRILLHGRFHDAVVYSIVRSNWPLT